MKREIPEIDFNRVKLLISMALDEDLGDLGDATTKSVMSDQIQATGILLAKEDLVFAGIEVARAVFEAVDPNIRFSPQVHDGDRVKKMGIIGYVEGSARGLLTAERTVLNFIQRLSGIATISNAYQSAVAPNSKTEILDTRKTTPGWRNLEKYAVAVGGAYNHRIGLFDRIMIKDNHLAIAGFEGPDAIARAVTRARLAFEHLKIQVEVDTLEQLAEALECQVDYILLDNMDDQTVAKAVEMTAGRCKLEASGGITLERITALSLLGVDYISVGALTHSVKSADISFDIQPKH